MKTVFTKVSFIQVHQRSLSLRARWVRKSMGVLRRGGESLLCDLRGEVPEITYSLSLMLVSAANLELDSIPSVHP